MAIDWGLDEPEDLEPDDAEFGDDEDLDDEDDEDDVDEGEFDLTAEDTVPILAAAAGESTSWYRGSRILVPTTTMQCRACGCTEEHGCPGGCVWAAPNLCSRCARS